MKKIISLVITLILLTNTVIIFASDYSFILTTTSTTIGSNNLSDYINNNTALKGYSDTQKIGMRQTHFAEFLITSEKTGTYNLSLFAGSKRAHQYDIYIDGIHAVQTTLLSASGGYDNYIYESIGNVYMSEGTHTLKIYMKVAQGSDMIYITKASFDYIPYTYNLNDFVMTKTNGTGIVTASGSYQTINSQEDEIDKYYVSSPDSNAEFNFYIPEEANGLYDIYTYLPATIYTGAMKADICVNNAKTSIKYNISPLTSGIWYYMGSFYLTDRFDDYVTLTKQSTQGYGSFAALRFVKTNTFNQTYSIYVSNDGSDEGDGSLENPVKTIEAAKKVAAQIKYQCKDIDIILRGGEYIITEPIKFYSKDSACRGGTITYRNYEGETPILNGSAKLGEVYQNDDGLLYAECYESTVRQLFVNGQKATRAQYPNKGTEKSQFPKIDSELENNSITVSNISLPDDLTSDDIEICTSGFYSHRRFHVTNYNVGNNTATFNIPQKEADMYNNSPIDNSEKLTNNILWLENDYAFLDSPGEWYYDDINNIIYYYPQEGETKDNTTFQVPIVENIIEFCGTADNPVSGITFDGIKFTGTTWLFPESNALVGNLMFCPSDYSTSAEDYRYIYNIKEEQISGAITGKYTNNLTIKNCIFDSIGGTSISLTEGGENILIENSTFSNIGGMGISVGGSYNKTTDFRMYHQNIVISNNIFDNLANEIISSPAVKIYMANNIDISHNTISNLPYTGICLGIGYIHNEYRYQYNYNVRNNKISNVLQLMSDGGAIYLSGSTFGKNVISGNYITGNVSKTGTAIYFDGSSRNYTAENNLICEFNVPFIMQYLNTQIVENITICNNFVQGNTLVRQENGRDELTANKLNLKVFDNILFEDKDSIPENAGEIISNSGTSDNLNKLLSQPEKSIEINIISLCS